jgi:cysteine desulfurase
MSIYGDKSSEIVEESRRVISKYIGAEHNEIIFTKSATESLNTCIFGIEHKLKENDEILLSILEHHANIVPYQIIAKKSHSKIKYVYLKKDYGFNYEEFEEKITKKTKIVGITMQSNVTGEEIDIEKICDILKKRSEKLGIDIPYLIIDGSQAITHKKINLKELKEIFAFVFSGHKLYGPQGIGVLYLKREKIGEVNPRNYGGDMIEYVLEDNVTFKEGFEKFEGGTLNIAGIHGLAKAIIYIEKIGIENIERHLKDLTKYTIQKLKKEVRNIRIYANKNTCRYSYICDKRNTFT